MRFVVWALLAATTVGICLTSIQLWQEYQRRDARINADMQQILVTVKGIAAKAAARQDTDAANDVLLGLMRHRAILSAAIEIPDAQGRYHPLRSHSRGVVAVGFLANLTHEIFSDSRDFIEPLHQATATGQTLVGRLHLVIDTSPDGQQFLESAKWNLVYGLLRALLLALVLVALAYYLITRPFNRFARWLRDVDVTNPKVPSKQLLNRDDEISASAQQVSDLLQRSAKQQQQLRLVEARANYLRRYDRTTDLLNRSAFAAQVEEIVDTARDEENPISIISIDIDAFRAINETHGALFGDKVLFEVARRFEAAIEERGVLARAAADTFVLMVRGNTADANAIASELQFSLSDPLVIDGHQLVVTASIGYASMPEHGNYRDELTQYAEQALQAAKETGGNRIQAYTPALSELRQRHEELTSRFRYALQTGEVELHYQPQIDLQTQKIIGAEALLRWHHPEHGMISPAEFVPLLESSNQATFLGNWVIQQACRDLAVLNRGSTEPITVAVNVSALHLVECGLVETVKNALKRSAVKPEWLGLEITESALILNIEAAARTLSEIRGFGTYIVIDDFGTGHSSLLNLRRLPVDKIKIDRSFIQNLPEDREDGQVVAAIIGLGANLKLGVVAEGIETQAQFDFVRDCGCAEYQGFFGAKALPVAELHQRLKEQR